MADVENTNTETTVTENQQEQTTQENENTPTVEELMAELAKQKAEYAKLKNASDKSSKEAADYKKQLRAKQTAQEQEEEAKREADEQQKEYIAGLEAFQAKTLAKERYLMQGMPIELATKAAEADVNRDMDTLSDINKKFAELQKKQWEAEWKKSRPEANAGVGSEAMTKEQFNNMGMAEKSKLYRENQAEYERLSKL